MNKRYERQQEIIARRNVPVCIVGVGAIGRQVSLQLAAMGITPIQMFDFDCVDDVNLCSQGFLQNDMDAFKVDAVKGLMLQMNDEIIIRAMKTAYDPAQTNAEVMFLCVDDITVRSNIFEAEAAKGTTRLLLDGRMAAELAQVYRVDMTNERSMENYRDTLFTKEEAYEARCTSKSTIYCANICAGMMVSEFSRYLRGIHICDMYEYNIVGCEFVVIRPTII